MSSLRKESIEGYMDLLNEFEFAKRKFKGNDDSVTTIKLPIDLIGTKLAIDDSLVMSGAVKVQRDKLRLTCNVLGSIFAGSISKIIDHINELLQREDVADCTYILLVGGFSESELLQNTLRSTFRRKTVIIPDDAGLAVLKGAVMYGHRTSIISQRVCRYTYGQSTSHRYLGKCSHPVGRREMDENGDMRCRDLFSIHVRAGDTVVAGQEHEETASHPIHDTQTSIRKRIYRSSKKDPQLVTEEGCEMIGQFRISIENPGRENVFTTSMIFGGTEIEVKCIEESTGNVTKKRINFLERQEQL